MTEREHKTTALRDKALARLDQIRADIVNGNYFAAYMRSHELETETYDLKIYDEEENEEEHAERMNKR